MKVFYCVLTLCVTFLFFTCDHNKRIDRVVDKNQEIFGEQNKKLVEKAEKAEMEKKVAEEERLKLLKKIAEATPASAPTPTPEEKSRNNVTIHSPGATPAPTVSATPQPKKPVVENHTGEQIWIKEGEVWFEILSRGRVTSKMGTDVHPRETVQQARLRIIEKSRKALEQHYGVSVTVVSGPRSRNLRAGNVFE